MQFNLLILLVIYIDNFPLYIFIKGNKQPDILTKNLTKRAFKTTGLKMIFALLKNPNLIKKSYRDIAKVTNIALSTMALVIRDLRELGFLIDMGKKGKKLLQR
ncbi:MAG: hypothetical protein ISS13_02940 [Actinobacteria bacterium]|nr:hypothetical protein [Actinomycetota bacterium]